MPRDHTERKKKYVENLKQSGAFNDYKKKRAELEKARRLRQKKSLEQLSDAKCKQWMEKKRMENRERVRKYRKAKKEGTSSQDNTKEQNENVNGLPLAKGVFNFEHSYKTKSAVGKAYSKINKRVPSSPSKRKVMVTKLVRSLNDTDRQDVFDCVTSTVNKKEMGLSATLVDAIESFYQRDDISRISPNVKDAKYFRDVAGEKELRQIRHLTFYLAEVYQKFVEEYRAENNIDPPVKISKFCDLRPQHVLLMSETPRSSCLCIYHANFSQCCIAVNKHIPELPKEYSNMVKLLVCGNDSKECCFKTCKKCSPTVINQKLKQLSKYSTNKNDSVKWMHWVKDKKANRFENVEQTGTIQKLVDHLISIYAQFLKHSFIMHEQSNNFNNDTKRVDFEEYFDEAILQIDFAENWKSESQDEIQQANYNQKQVSVFTSALRHRKVTSSKVIASDNTHHTKDTIVAYLHNLFSTLPSTAKTVKIWSDGPTSQFKNKFIGATILLFEKLFKIKIFWNFFATAHGKACIDGIGAAVKKQVQDMVLTRKRTVYNTNDFVNAFGTVKSKVNVIGMTPEEIEEINVKLKLTNVFALAPDIPGIMSFHQLHVVGNRVKGYTTSKDGYLNSQNSPMAYCFFIFACKDLFVPFKNFNQIFNQKL